MRRRTVVASMGQFAMFGSLSGASQGAVRFSGYSSVPAPDAVSRLVLREPMARVDRVNVMRNSLASDMSSRFPIFVEQHFARRDRRLVLRLIGRLSRLELSQLSALYMRANSDLGRTPFLLDILANRLLATELASLSGTFDYPSLLEAVNRSAPKKVTDFTLLARPAGPAQLAFRSGSSVALPMAGGGFGYLDMQIAHIYLDFRTAPIGSLSVAGALFATATIVGTGLSTAYSTGYAIGTGISTLIQTVAPGLHGAIGGGIYNYIESLRTAPDAASLGGAEALGAAMFQLSADIGGLYQELGGDYGETVAWQLADGGGSSDCSKDGCPIML